MKWLNEFRQRYHCTSFTENVSTNYYVYFAVLATFFSAWELNNFNTSSIFTAIIIHPFHGNKISFMMLMRIKFSFRFIYWVNRLQRCMLYVVWMKLFFWIGYSIICTQTRQSKILIVFVFLIIILIDYFIKRCKIICYINGFYNHFEATNNIYIYT